MGFLIISSNWVLKFNPIIFHNAIRLGEKRKFKKVGYWLTSESLSSRTNRVSEWSRYSSGTPNDLQMANGKWRWVFFSAQQTTVLAITISTFFSFSFFEFLLFLKNKRIFQHKVDFTSLHSLYLSSHTFQIKIKIKNSLIVIVIITLYASHKKSQIYKISLIYFYFMYNSKKKLLF